MKIFLSILLLLFLQESISQTPQDYFNEEVKTGQGETTNKVVSALENSKISEAFKFFSDSTVSITKVELEKISKAINIVKPKTELSIVIVYEKGYNVYRCRYWNENDGALFQLDLYYKEGDKNSKVLDFRIKNTETLQNERKERLKTNQDLPPPPPPK